MKRLTLLVLPFVSACASFPDIMSYLTPYRIDVRQGNFVTQEMVSQLKAGQTKDQVRFILGTPLIADVFHADRWDYVYRYQPGHGEATQRRIVVYFADGKLARVAGDVVASASVARQAQPKPQTQVIDSAQPAPPAAQGATPGTTQGTTQGTK